MNKKETKSELKDIKVSVRLTQDMNKLIAMIAEEQSLTVGKYLRDAGLILAEMTLDEKEMLDTVKNTDKKKAQKTFHTMIQETKHTLMNSTKELSDRILKLEKLIKMLLYVYLYHTPEINKSKKEEAKKSAKLREKKILEFLDSGKHDE